MNSNHQMKSVNQIQCCEVCGNTTLEPVINLGEHPLCDDLVPIGDRHIHDQAGHGRVETNDLMVNYW